MTEQFDSVFHKRYVSGDGIVIEKGPYYQPKNEVIPQTYEDILAEYRKYVGDPEAELPDEIVEHLRVLGKI